VKKEEAAKTTHAIAMQGGALLEEWLPREMGFILVVIDLENGIGGSSLNVQTKGAITALRSIADDMEEQTRREKENGR
jgi:hypothetical protein